MSIAHREFRRSYVGEVVREIKSATKECRSDIVPRADLSVLNGKGTAYARHVVSAGERFDSLVTVKMMLRHERQGAMWLCQCDCGGQAFRYAAKLTQGARKNHSQRCADCLRQHRRLLRETWREAVGEAYRKQFVDYQTLWTPGQTERMVSDIRDELVAEFGEQEEWTPRVPFSPAVGWRGEKRAERREPPQEKTNYGDMSEWVGPKTEVTPELWTAIESLEESA